MKFYFQIILKYTRQDDVIVLECCSLLLEFLAFGT